MTARQRWAAFLLILLLVCGPLQGGSPVPIRPTQGPVLSSPDAIVLPVEPVEDDLIDPPPPVVAIRVRVPACATVGQELCYKICVENCSRVPAHHVLVRNPLPCNARFVKAVPEPNVREPEVVWCLGTLAPCEKRELCLFLCPTGPGEIKNCARVRFEHGQMVCTRVEGCPGPLMPPAPVPSPGPSPGPVPTPIRGELALRKSGPAQAVLFEPFVYQLNLANTGSEPARDVVVTDQLPPALEAVGRTSPLTWNVGTLEPGREWKVEYQVIARQPGRWCNQAAVTAAGGQRQEASSCVQVSRPQLGLHLNAPAQRSVNSVIAYRITVSNTTPVAATNVIVADMLPANATFDEASDGGKLMNGQVTWALGTLPAGEKKTVTLTLRGKAVGEVLNKVTASADRHESAEAEAKTIIDEGATGLTFDIDDQTDPLEVGGETTYKITVRNQGSAVAKAVAIKATVPPQLEVTTAKGPSTFKQEGAVVTFEPMDLDVGKTATYDIMVKALKAGEVRFAAELSSEVFTSGQPVRKEESTTIFNP